MKYSAHDFGAEEEYLYFEIYNLQKSDKNLVTFSKKSIIAEMKRILLDSLGLTKKEHVILDVLRSFALAQTETKIAEAAELPRTTVAFLLRKLEKRKLAERVRSHNRFQWKYRKHLDIFEVTEKTTRSIMFVKKGMYEISREMLRILDLPPSHRLLAIQGAGISQSLMKKIDYKFLLAFHEQLKKRHIIIEGVIAESVLKLFDKMTEGQLASHLDRMTVVYVLPDELINFPLDVFIVKDYVVLVDYETERFVRIDDEALLQAFSSLFYLAEQFGKKIDLNDYIRKLIEKKN